MRRREGRKRNRREDRLGEKEQIRRRMRNDGREERNRRGEGR